MNDKVTILGIDPGYGTCGFSVIKKTRLDIEVLNYGVITTDKDVFFQERLVQLGDDIVEILEKYNPQILAIEKIFWGANVDNAIKVAEARGVIEFLCQKNKMKIIEYSPTQIKSQLVGHGHAPKFQIQNMVQLRLGLSEVPQPDDAADALAIALIAAEEVY